MSLKRGLFLKFFPILLPLFISCLSQEYTVTFEKDGTGELTIVTLIDSSAVNQLSEEIDDTLLLLTSYEYADSLAARVEGAKLKEQKTTVKNGLYRATATYLFDSPQALNELIEVGEVTLEEEGRKSLFSFSIKGGYSANELVKEFFSDKVFAESYISVSVNAPRKIEESSIDNSVKGRKFTFTTPVKDLFQQETFNFSLLW